MKKNIIKTLLIIISFLAFYLSCTANKIYYPQNINEPLEKEKPENNQKGSQVAVVELIRMENPYGKVKVFYESDKYGKIDRYLTIAFEHYPGFIKKNTGINLQEEAFYSKKSELEIQFVSDKTLNGKIIQSYGMLLPVDGLYDNNANIVYINTDDNADIIIHEFFHFLRDISGIVLDKDEEEKLADEFANYIQEIEKDFIRAKIKK